MFRGLVRAKMTKARIKVPQVSVMKAMNMETLGAGWARAEDLGSRSWRGE